MDALQTCRAERSARPLLLPGPATRRCSWAPLRDSVSTGQRTQARLMSVGHISASCQDRKASALPDTLPNPVAAQGSRLCSWTQDRLRTSTTTNLGSWPPPTASHSGSNPLGRPTSTSPRVGQEPFPGAPMGWEEMTFELAGAQDVREVIQWAETSWHSGSLRHAGRRRRCRRVR